MFWYIIANPAAGNGAVQRKWPLIEQQLQAMGFSYTVQFTTHKGHATQLAENAILRGQRYLLGIGGDGTNFEIINGIMQQNAVPSTDVHYALLPVGTGNDWAFQYQITHDITRRLAQLQHPEIRFQDVGRVDFTQFDGQPATRYFANVAGMAYDGFVAQKMEQNGKPATKLAYLWAVGRYLMAYTLSKGRIVWDTHHRAEDAFYTINVGICKYSGGGMQLVPHAIPDDGLLALTFARSMSKVEVLAQTFRFYNGTLLQHRQVTGVQATTVEVHPDDPAVPILLEADGEVLGYAPAVFSLLPSALKIVL